MAEEGHVEWWVELRGGAGGVAEGGGERDGWSSGKRDGWSSGGGAGSVAGVDSPLCFCTSQ